MSAAGSDACAPVPRAVWAGKADKTGRRLFAYHHDGGRIRLQKIGDPDDLQLRREHEHLEVVGRALADTPLAQTIPGAPVYRPGLLEMDCLAGTPITDLLVHARRSASARRRALQAGLAAVGWLAAFHERLRTPDGGDVLAGGVHGDFKPSNVLDTGAGVAVVDWELFEPDGRQLFDLFHWGVSFGLTCAGSLTPSAFADAFVAPGWIAGAIAEMLHEYHRRRGAVPGDLRAGFTRYADELLARRQRLGLSNAGHFLHGVRQVIDAAPSIPASLAPR